MPLFGFSASKCRSIPKLSRIVRRGSSSGRPSRRIEGFQGPHSEHSLDSQPLQQSAQGQSYSAEKPISKDLSNVGNTLYSISEEDVGALLVKSSIFCIFSPNFGIDAGSEGIFTEFGVEVEVQSFGAHGMGQRVCLEEGVFGAVLVIPGTSHALFFAKQMGNYQARVSFLR